MPLELNNVRAVLESWGQETVGEMRRKLETPQQRRSGSGRFRSLTTNAVATGNLVDSISYRVVWQGAEAYVEFSMADYGVYVDRGRRPGKMPPLRAIREWTRVKGIPERAAFPIARKIGREGIAARPFFESTATQGIDALVEELEAAYALDVAEYVASTLR